METIDFKIALRKTAKRILSFGAFWVPEQTLEHLKSIRNHEMDVVLNMMPLEGKVLEIGAGTGWQAQVLETRGYDVRAIDLPSSIYLASQVWPVIEYDGKTIPFEDNAFDVVFSSNVLEHIPHVYEFQKEIHRVLKPGGCVIHVLPSSSWRFWTNITHPLRYCWTIPNIHGLVANVHGEHASNSLTEIYFFSRRWWNRLFRETGWEVAAQKSNGLFYTGTSIFDSRLTINLRRKISHVLGSSCNVFILKNGSDS